MTIAQRIWNVTKIDGFGGIARSPLLPLALLLLALSTVFAFGGDRGHFYRPITHSHPSAEHLTVAVNLSPSHRFLMFHRQTLDGDGNRTYAPYNRFPITGYAGIKLATLPFEGNTTAEIYAARMLMLLFFAAAAVMAYLSLCRLTSNRWIALIATMLAFSSYYLLYYNDMIALDGIPDFFGVMLTFHGMVVFLQDGRFRQLLVKTCIALLLGWHVYAILLPFVVFGLAGGLWRARSSAADSTLPRYVKLKRTAAALLRSRYLLLGAIALALGVSILSFNMAHEYFALEGKTPLTELPSFESILNRTGLKPRPEWWADDPNLGWRSFMERQFYRVARAFIPYSLPVYSPWPSSGPEGGLWGLGPVTGAALSAACLIGSVFVRQRILFATLASFGFVWALPMRHSTVVHENEGIYYVGLPLAFFSLILMYIHKHGGFKRFLKGGRRRAALVVLILSIAALLVFASSSFQIAREHNHDLEAARFRDAVVQDFDVIRGIAKDKVVFVHLPGSAEWDITKVPRSMDYYLTGIVVLYNHPFHQKYRLRKFSDYILTGYRVDVEALLTPENRAAFLYDRRMYDAEIGRMIRESGDPVFQSNWDVHYDGDVLIYAKKSCEERDTASRFLLRVYPVDAGDLPSYRRQDGADNLDFTFAHRGGQTEDRCFATRRLPPYDVAMIYTGQLDANGPVWEGVFDLAGRDIDRMIEDSGDPVIRSDFDVYLDGSTLIYARDSCGESDVDARFFLHVHPVDAGDLPSSRRQHGFDNLDFDFNLYGWRIGDRCFAARRLPLYDIVRVSTGQFDSNGRIWQGEFDAAGNP